MNRFLFLLAIAGLSSCTPKQVETEVYSVLYDTTDPLLANPEAAALWDYIDGDDPSKDLVFRYGKLSDVDVTITHQLERPALSSGLFSNALQEKKRLDKFQTALTTLVATPDSIGASHSAIFEPILEELEYLASIPDGYHRELIVFSNLMENSDWMRLYYSRDLWLLENQPDAIVERYLSRTEKNSNYKGVKLSIVYIPRDFDDNLRFKRIRGVYTKVFQGLGVSISFSGNLQRLDGSL